MHHPVLLNKVLEYLNPEPGQFIIDGTADGGGYAAALLDRLGSGGTFLAVDWDTAMIEKLRLKLEPFRERGVRLLFLDDNFANLPLFLKKERLGLAHALVLDLGFSSDQLEESGRGFSFLKNEPLLMTYSDKLEPVNSILRRLRVEELTALIKTLSQERYAERIAKAIKERGRSQPIATTQELAKVIKRAVPKNYERGRLDPATRTFMALRIYANRELENLESVLNNLPQILRSGGRLAIVSFHSLEDALVKRKFKEFSKVGELQILTPKPLRAGREEVTVNPRARSAKLRGALVL